MHSEKDNPVVTAESPADSLEKSKENTLNWLMDMDRDEPEENLFVVERKAAEVTLSAYEAEVAARPMMRGRAGADELDAFVSEEIVMSADGSSSSLDSQSEEESAFEGLMAIDFSREEDGGESIEVARVDDGSDILGLVDDDDIGEAYLVVKRTSEAVSPACEGDAEEVPAAPASRTELCGTSAQEQQASREHEHEHEMEVELQLPVVEDAASYDAIDADDVDSYGEELEEIVLFAEEDDFIENGVELVLEEEIPADLAVSDVASYVANVQAPESEEAFDEYLVAGSDLAAGDEDLDELVLETDAQEFSVDTELDGALDLHEDFVAMDGFDDELMTIITPRLPVFMEEVNAAIGARLVSLGRPGDAVVADVSVATDLQTSASAREQGYEPISAICADVPEALEGLQASQLEAVMLRLTDVESGESCNRLFLEEPATDSESSAPVLTVVESTVFDDDIFGEELLAEVPPGDWAPENEEIDAIFDDFGSDEQSLAFDGVLPESSLPDVADDLEFFGGNDFEDDAVFAETGNLVEFGETAEVMEIPAVAECVDIIEVEAIPEAEVIDDKLQFMDVAEASSSEENSDTAEDLTADAAVVSAEAADAQSETASDEMPDEDEVLKVFEEDFFEADLVDEESLAAASAEDIDRLLQDLGPEMEAANEICGVEVEAFSDTSANEDLDVEAIEVVEVAVPTAAEAGDMSWCIPEGIRFHHSSPTSGEIFAEFLDAFIEEGSSELEKLEDAVSAWEADIASEESYTQVARILHTIKGIAKGVGLHFYGTLVHNFETLLEGMQRPAAGEEHDYFRIVNAWLDAAVRGMDFVQNERRDILSEFPVRGDQSIDDDAQDLEAKSTVALPLNDEVPAEPVAAKADVQQQGKDVRRKQQDKKLADEGARALAAQQSVRITSEKLDLLLNLSNQAQQLGVRTAQSTNRNKRASAELMGRLSSVRAHIADIADGSLFNVTARGGARASELDALEMDQYSELQEAANILREGVEDLADLIEVASRHNAQAEALLKQQASVIGSIGSTIRAARVVPVSRLMPGLRRLVRTVSNDLGKDVAFRVANEVGTLDRDDYARCQTILEHMVRNALDHGIESAEERVAAGKPSVGQITVDVRMSGADSVIVLSDDGRGIDPDAMRESAIRKGLELDVYALSDDEARNLIFHKGFSTAATLSQISGRGVGMDIVQSELQQMGGDIRIESELGKGTSFHIRVPANVTVNGALLVTAGENSYAIPLGGLVAVEEVPVDEFFSAVESGDKLLMSGMDCEPAYLGTLCQSGNLPDRSSWRSSVPVIIAGSEARYMAIAIDDVEEALELVIRSLGAQFASVPGVAGAATTADGEAVVALDLNVLVSCFAEGQGTAVAVEQPEEEKFLALVVDDSRTQRMVATSQLETVGVETATAENGAVAIDWLNTTEHLPDVILLDVEMPVKDGIQTLREIRKSARYSHIPVIMVTSRTGIKHRTMAEEAGCNGYMGKPFNFRMLIGQINELTGHRLELG